MYLSLEPSVNAEFFSKNSAIAEGLVLLRDGILDSSELAVLCFCYWPSGHSIYFTEMSDELSDDHRRKHDHTSDEFLHRQRLMKDQEAADH